MVNVIRGDVDKPESSRRLAEFFEKRSDIDGSLYLGYPIIGTSQGGYQIDALLVSREQGVVIFNIVEGTDISLNIEEVQDESINKIQSKLLQQKSLTNKRKLMVELGVVTYAPAWSHKPERLDDEYPVIISDSELTNYLEKLEWPSSSEYFEELNSVIQAMTSIRKRNQRSYVKQENSRGAKLYKLEESIANLDRNQSAAVIETVEGVQRIRGLAGSGKTIVLALKTAYLHAKHPDWHIAVTFNTRSLKGQFKQLINTFTIEHKSEEPDWEKVKIIHAWGSPSIEGIYYEFCKRHNIEYRDLNSAKTMAKYGQEFDRVCEEALNKIKNYQRYYDAILIDEAQDFSKHFLRLCYEILKEPKRMVYAYDELQNLNKKTMESPEVIFGTDVHGKPRVQLQNKAGESKQDIILEKCYRNSRPILTSAHALGFGIYRNEGLIQMFENAGLWRDIGYEVEAGSLEDGKFVKLSRTNNTSPKFLESHSDIEDLIMLKSFDSNKTQIEWLINEIEKNLKEDELKGDDIMVIHSNPLTTREAVGDARALLFEKRINSNLAGVTTSPDDFFREETITFTSINRAKGNEAAMIYVINAQECFSGYELAIKRNILFTAMTRSKAWLRVLGYGENMRGLVEEFNKIREKKFVLEFTYPTEEERKEMNLINREIKLQGGGLMAKSRSSLIIDLIEALEKGEIQKKDLPQELVNKLKDKL
ncbi:MULTISPECIES: ATP-binding domain-containing protein [unclassified Microcoleus]|uniref:ATP-binding domain-containing protein n=1 Tax=unclassified Microcoleus TaxID=2642155 RepID=UPI002FD072A3